MSPAFPSIIFVETPRAKVHRIAAEIGAAHGVTVHEILGSDRRAAVVDARYDTIRRVKEENPAWTTTQLGKLFGRDHTTICYALGACSRKPQPRRVRPLPDALTLLRDYRRVGSVCRLAQTYRVCEHRLRTALRAHGVGSPFDTRLAALIAALEEEAA